MRRKRGDWFWNDFFAFDKDSLGVDSCLNVTGLFGEEVRHFEEEAEHIHVKLLGSQVTVDSMNMER